MGLIPKSPQLLYPLKVSLDFKEYARDYMHYDIIVTVQVHQRTQVYGRMDDSNRIS